jgi:glycosyltransferase involved in cell wall biosynthesis
MMIAVVIGRNEGAKLGPSLRSVQAAALTLVYSDSGSTDGSPDCAKELGVPTVELDPSRPFSAARARNEGLDEALRRWPAAAYVVFLDADCVLDSHFPLAACAIFEKHPKCAIVTGHLSERHPDASIYNRLCAIEWRSPAGQIENFAALGGIMAARISALRHVGGFNEQVIAGEDSELGVRIALANYTVIKIDRPMAVHDAEIMHFGGWWKRSVRAGHALAQRYSLNGRSSVKDCQRELLSTLLWGCAVPVTAVGLLGLTRGLSLLMLGGYAVLAWRVRRHYVRFGVCSSDAGLAARFTVYGKFANFLGVLRFCLNRLRGRFRIIEYK